ncbi:MAG: TRAM domain-containing protein, partial [Saprospiraceae bacterium]
MARRKRYPEQILNVTITGMADKGFCVGRDPEGQVVFVEKTAPGDVVDVRVFKKKRKVLCGAP